MVAGVFASKEGGNLPSGNGPKKPSLLVGEGWGGGAFAKGCQRNKTAMNGTVEQPQFFITARPGGVMADHPPRVRVEFPLTFPMVAPTRIGRHATHSGQLKRRRSNLG